MRLQNAQPDPMPNLFIIAGPNGAGKTTYARRFLPEEMRTREFVNADQIAAGLSPFAPGNAAFEAQTAYDRLRKGLDGPTREALDRILGAFFWAQRSGQNDDLYTPGMRILLDEDKPDEDKK